jgi:cob(I)alamin adenosyltransferase
MRCLLCCVPLLTLSRPGPPLLLPRGTEMPDSTTGQRDNSKKREAISKGQRGLITVNTGKGKTTAALGLMMRADGWGLNTKLFQFLKHGSAQSGERRTLDQVQTPDRGLGDGWTRRSKDLKNSAELAPHGWILAKEAILSGDHDLIVLAELTSPLKYGWVPRAAVNAVLRARDPRLPVVITGRDALPELVALADTVSEIQSVKHAYQARVGGQPGTEYGWKGRAW